MDIPENPFRCVLGFRAKDLGSGLEELSAGFNMYGPDMGARTFLRFMYGWSTSLLTFRFWVSSLVLRVSEFQDLGSRA